MHVWIREDRRGKMRRTANVEGLRKDSRKHRGARKSERAQLQPEAQVSETRCGFTICVSGGCRATAIQIDGPPSGRPLSPTGKRIDARPRLPDRKAR
jgi:hypothetical protein